MRLWTVYVGEQGWGALRSTAVETWNCGTWYKRKTSEPWHILPPYMSRIWRVVKTATWMTRYQTQKPEQTWPLTWQERSASHKHLGTQIKRKRVQGKQWWMIKLGQTRNNIKSRQSRPGYSTIANQHKCVNLKHNKQQSQDCGRCLVCRLICVDNS
jgi:hypothetical protein